MKLWSVLLLLSPMAQGASAPAAGAQGNFTIQFDRPAPEISPGQTLLLPVPMEPAPLAGLYSYAIKLSLDDLKARVAGLSGIQVPRKLEETT